MTFDEFYRRDYLGRHAAPVCRLFHLLGPPASAAYLAVVLWLQVWWLLVLLPIPTYLLAWLGHVVVGNQPTFFEHPLWSFFAYWKMIGSTLAGQTGREEVSPGRKPCAPHFEKPKRPACPPPGRRQRTRPAHRRRQPHRPGGLRPRPPSRQVRRTGLLRPRRPRPAPRERPLRAACRPPLAGSCGPAT